jgi:hypothetical protein
MMTKTNEVEPIGGAGDLVAGEFGFGPVSISVAVGAQLSQVVYKKSIFPRTNPISR